MARSWQYSLVAGISKCWTYGESHGTDLFSDGSLRPRSRIGDHPCTGEHFSLEIELGDPDLAGRVPARFRFLAPELVGDYLTPGSIFMVMEGPRPVGEAEVITVADKTD